MQTEQTATSTLRMLQGRGAIPYRHKLSPAVLSLMRYAQDELSASLGVKPSQAVIIARAVNVYCQHLDSGAVSPAEEMSQLQRVAGRTALCAHSA